MLFFNFPESLELFQPELFEGTYLLHLILTAVPLSASQSKLEIFSCLMTLRKASLQ